MRLINARDLQMKVFIGDEIPPYFILSHRWTGDETTYRDFVEGNREDSLGHKKVESFCNFIVKHFGQEQQDLYVWIDTCCIDKTSSAELTEDINSMYAYYQKSIICFVYLIGINLSRRDQAIAGATKDNAKAQAGHAPNLRRDMLWTTESVKPFRPEWFQRGWTLQELLAPDTVVFLDKQWKVIGRKQSESVRPRKVNHGARKFDSAPDLNSEISQITCIQEKYLLSRDAIHSATIAERMSWAANRKTTRREDKAYCLLGLFNVNMPLLYGEGKKAFVRLQKELIATSTDQSIFAWWLPTPRLEDLIGAGEKFCSTGILAPGPECFQNSGAVIKAKNAPSTRPYAVTNAGLELCAKVRRLDLQIPEADLPMMSSPRAVYTTRLNCLVDGRAGRDRIKIAIVGEESKVQQDDVLTGFRRLHSLEENFLDEPNEVGGVEDKTFYVHVVNPVPGKKRMAMFGMQ